MSSSNFNARDITFRRSSEDEYTITVYGQNVGSVTRRIDYAIPDRSYYYVLHLSEDWKGPRQLDDRNEDPSGRCRDARRTRSCSLDPTSDAPGCSQTTGTFPPDPLPPCLQPGRSRADNRHEAGPFFL